MKTLIISVLTVFALNFGDLEQIKIGDAAPKADLKMESVDGKKTSLSDLKKENGLCVIFSCNTCPYVIGWEDRYNEIEAAYLCSAVYCTVCTLRRLFARNAFSS